MAKRKISVDEFVKDVTSGQGDSELMEKYRLSRKQLDAMFTKLLERGQLRPADLVADQTVPVWAATQELGAICPVCGASKVFDQAPCPKCGYGREGAETGEPTDQPQRTPEEQATVQEPQEPENPWDGQISLPPYPGGPRFQEEADIELDMGSEPDLDAQEETPLPEPPAAPKAPRGGRRAFLLATASLVAVVVIAAGIGFYLELIPFPGEPAPPPPAPRSQVAKARKPPEPALKTPDGLKRSPGALSPETESMASARVEPDTSTTKQSADELPASTKPEDAVKQPEKIAAQGEVVAALPEKPEDAAPEPPAATPPQDEGRTSAAPAQPALEPPDRTQASVPPTHSSTPVAAEPAPTRQSSDEQREQKETVARQQPPSELVEAVKREDIPELNRLLQSGVDPNSRDKEGVTALMHAATEGRDAAATLLLKYGANPNLKDDRGATALLLARETGHEKIVSLLAGYEKDKGSGALLEAARNGQMDLVQSQVQSGVNLNATDEDGNTPLMLAAEMGHLEVVNLLLDSGADITTRNKNGATALSRAYSPGATKAFVPLKVRRDIVRVLKEHGRTGIGALGRH
ncbi:MAG: ankyrin repeat domain-containing protein [Desulfomonile tiedjei]|nr:ankyrin repeat domain-containing protein [Desulfomonile tiedjei]